MLKLKLEFAETFTDIFRDVIVLNEVVPAFETKAYIYRFAGTIFQSETLQLSVLQQLQLPLGQLAFHKQVGYVLSNF